MLSDFITTWKFVIKRSLSHARLLVSVVIGVLLAAAILSGTVIYFNSLKEIALDASLDAMPSNDLDIVSKAVRGPTTVGEYEKVSNLIVGEATRNIGWFSKNLISGGSSATFFLTKPGKEDQAGKDNARAYFLFSSDLNEHAGLIDGGKIPDNSNNQRDQNSTLVIEALISEEAAWESGIEIGDTLSVVPFWSDEIDRASVVVTGVLRKLNSDTNFWHLNELVFSANTGESFRTVPFYVSEDTYFQILGKSFTDMDTNYGWMFTVQKDLISADKAQDGIRSIGLLESTVRAQLPNYRQFTSLDELLVDYEKRLFFSKLPMFVLLVLVAVVVLYYIVTLSGLLIERQKGEIALLRSRGAGFWHLISIFTVEGLTISGLSIVLGPLMAAGAIKLAGSTPIFAELLGGTGLDVKLSGAAYALGAVGGVFSFCALMIPAIQASRVSVTAYRRESARPSGLPFFQKYYIDVLLLILLVVLFRQLTEQGSLFASQAFGKTTANYLLLAVPAITLLGFALVLLRLFPVVLNLASRVLSKVLPVGPTLGLWQMARNPAYYARLSLLLILTAGLGIFAASFGGTLDRSFKERVLYSTGSEIRIDGISMDAIGYTKPLQSSYEQIDGVSAASSVYRGRAYDYTDLTSDKIQILGINPSTFDAVGWFRDDFFSTNKTDVLELLKSDQITQGIPIPENARTLAIIAKSSRPQPTVRLAARIVDVNGRYFTYEMGNLSTANVQLYEVSLTRTSRSTSRLLRGQQLEPTAPLRLVSIAIDETNTLGSTFPGQVTIGQISVRDSEGTRFEIDESVDNMMWNPLSMTSDSVGDFVTVSELSVEGIEGESVTFNWSSGPSLVPRGIYYGNKMSFIPVIGSDSFVSSSGHQIGDIFYIYVASKRIPVKLVDIFSYFPTLDVNSQIHLVTDINALMSFANLDTSQRELKPNEMWLKLNVGGQEKLDLVESLKIEPFGATNVFERDALLQESSVDPLTKAGWRAILFIAFGAVFILSCLGFVVHAYVSFSGRRVQFALLRTVGLTQFQIGTVVLLEQVFVIATGMALGAWMGQNLGAIIMPFIANDDVGTQVLPPFVTEISWVALIGTYAAMVTVFTAITFSMIWFVRRISVVTTLRIGEN